MTKFSEWLLYCLKLLSTAPSTSVCTHRTFEDTCERRKEYLFYGHVVLWRSVPVKIEGGKGFFREPSIANICRCEMRFDEFLCREM